MGASAHEFRITGKMPVLLGVLMIWAYILGGITTLGLLVYLLIALLKPEKF
jgi:K+-transporting ATPase KdpF subunit